MKEYLFDLGRLRLEAGDTGYETQAILALSEDSTPEKGEIIGAARTPEIAASWNKTLSSPVWETVMKRNPELPLGNLMGNRSYQKYEHYKKGDFSPKEFMAKVESLAADGWTKIIHRWNNEKKDTDA